MIRRAFYFVVVPVLFGYAWAASLGGCGASLTDIEDATKATDQTSKTLSKCRGDARAAFYVGQVSEADALAVYAACKKDAGL